MSLLDAAVTCGLIFAGGVAALFAAIPLALWAERAAAARNPAVTDRLAQVDTHAELAAAARERNRREGAL